MPHVITDRCAGAKDRACVDVCPVDAIHPYPTSDGQNECEAVPQLYIDPGTCIDCGACFNVCPVQAIFPADDLPVDLKHFIQVNADYYRNRL